MRYLTDRRVILVLRVGLGVLFIMAALPKLADPVSFARNVSYYHMAPEWAERALALVLPPLELVVGICLIVGVLDAGAALLTFAMLVVFTAAVGVAVARGLDISCGCFETEGGAKVGIAKLAENAVMLAAAWLVFVGDRSLLTVRRLLSRSGDTD